MAEDDLQNGGDSLKKSENASETNASRIKWASRAT
jgi:hypothetical protein